MKRETYGNPYRSGEKNIDDLYKKMIDDMVKESKKETKCQYIMKDIFHIMSEFGWEDTDNIKVDIGGVSSSGIQQTESSNLKWSKPYGTITYQPDAFIVIKNENRNPGPSEKILPEGKGKPVNISD